MSHLRSVPAGVDPETGEVTCASCRALEDQIIGLQRDIRGWAARYAELKRDKEGEAERHELWGDARDIFTFWTVACKHPKSRFDASRFELIRPHLEKHGGRICRQAIEGAAFDPFITQRKNGSAKRHDGWELIFRDAGKLEEFVNRAPRSGQNQEAEAA